MENQIKKPFYKQIERKEFAEDSANQRIIKEKKKELEKDLETVKNEDCDCNTGFWTKEEIRQFEAAVIKYGNKWKEVKKEIATRSVEQVRSHAQKYSKMAFMEALRKYNKTKDTNPQIFIVHKDFARIHRKANNNAYELEFAELFQSGKYVKKQQFTVIEDSKETKSFLFEMPENKTISLNGIPAINSQKFFGNEDSIISFTPEDKEIEAYNSKEIIAYSEFQLRHPESQRMLEEAIEDQSQQIKKELS